MPTNGVPGGSCEACSGVKRCCVGADCGACPEDFARLTGATPEGFDLQLKALENLVEEGIDCFPAVMVNFSIQKEIQKLRQRLKAIRPDFADFEEEELILYPFVLEHLQKAGLSLSI
jgi:uncharacterized Fe-S cluster-containing radical SAM superfamily protein